MMAPLFVDVGDRLLPADAHNPAGHFKEVTFLHFHRQVLSQLCLPNEPGCGLELAVRNQIMPMRSQERIVFSLHSSHNNP
jgi:hypothetical protein